TANIVVVAAPIISKVFSPDSVKLDDNPTLTFTISNPNTDSSTALTGVGFTDNLPTGLQVATTPSALATNCGSPTFNPSATDTSLTFSGATVAAGLDCVVSVKILAQTVGIKDNTSTAVVSTNGGNGNTATDTLSVNLSPTVTKAFGVSTIKVNGTTSLTFSISNPNTVTDLTGIAFSDTFPAGLQVASPLSYTIAPACGTNATFSPALVAGALSLSIQGVDLAHGAACTASVDVTPTSMPTKDNTTGIITSNESGPGTTSNTASLKVVIPPTISKAFSVASIPLSTTYATLSFTLVNPNPDTTLTGVAFTDALPSGLVVWTTPTASTSGCGGTPSFGPASGAASLTFSSGTILANSTCTVSVRVYGTSKGSKDNTTSAITSTEGGTGSVSNTANIVVVAAPIISKVFSPVAIRLNENTTLTFTISNPNTDLSTILTGVGFTDNLPSGLQVAAIPSVVITNCGSPTFNPLAADTSLDFSGASVATGLDCVVSVNLLANTVGIKDNTSAAVFSANGGIGNTAVDSLSVNLSPTVSKAFGDEAIKVTGATSMTFTISNPNTITDLTGIAFSDTFPAGLQVSNPLSYNIAPECGANAIFSPTLVPGALSLALQGVDLAHGASCTVSVNVTPTSMPTKHNTTGIITSNESGPGTTSNTASLRAIVPPIISKAFSAATVPLNIDYRTLTFTLVNPNPLTSLSGVEFTDTFPAGLAVWNVPTVSTSGCGTPTFDPAAGDTSLTFSNGTIPAVSTCTISVRVVGTTQGTKNNTTSVVDSIEGGTGLTSDTASLVVVAPPVIAKVFSPDSIKLGGPSTLTFTITNLNTDSSTSLTGVGFTDSLPEGLQVADLPAEVITSCGSATFSPVAADTALTISGATVEPGIDCVISVDLLAQTIGIKNNTSSVIDSSNGGSGNTASDTLSVNLSPTVSKAFAPDTILINHTSTLTFTISNPNTSTDLTRIAFSDTFPAGLQVAAPLDAQIAPGCGKNATFSPGLVAGALSVSIESVDLAHGASCTITVEVKATTRDTKDNTTGPITSYESEPGTTSNTAQINVDDPLLTLTKTLVSGEPYDQVGDVLSYNYHLQNTGNVPLTGKGPAGIFSVLDDKTTVVCPAGVNSLLPDETVDCTAVYRVTQKDLDHGSVTNIAHAVAYLAPFTLDVLSSEESVTVGAAQAPAINAINTASINPNIVPPANAINIGDILTYSFSVTNPGNVSLSDIRVIGSKCDTPTTMDKGRSRDLDGDKKLDVFIPKINEEIWVYECKHTLTQLELDAGKILNDIEVLGKAPVGTDVSTTSSLETSLLEVPLIGLAKRVVGNPQKVSPGVWDVTYEFNIHNYGNVTLHNIQISDDLSKAFAIPENLKEIVKTPTEFSVRSLTSPDFAVNWPGYNGKTQLDLLKNATINSNQISSGKDARVIMVVRVTPTFSNPLNIARVVGFSPTNVEKNDISQNGIDPDPEPKDDDPTNNNQPTPVIFAAHVFEPPFGKKMLDDSKDPIFSYNIVWINDTNIVPIYVEASDGVPLGTQYIDNGIITTGILPSGTLPAGSVASGVSCVPASEGTTTIYCYFEGPTLDYPRGRIVWRGTLGPDLGIKIPSFAKNAISITFDLLIQTDVVENIATLDMLDPFERFFTNARSSWNRKMLGLPVTGFPLDQVTLIPEQPKSARYTDLKDLWLDIPTLGIHADIVGVPEDGAGSWDTSWLGDRVGYLAGSTFPTWVGNSVITGHVWDANNQPGVFTKLKLLKYGDRFTIQAYGQTYTYEVRETSLVMPNDISRVMEPQTDYSWVTLLTCEGYNAFDKSYTSRRMIRAVLISEK
ncbi:MAG: sortase, partial [Chloroflexota bacterium]